MDPVTFRCARPSPALTPFVELFWWVRGVGPFEPHTVLPDGAVELMVNFGPRQRVRAYGERAVDEAFHHAWVAGVQDQRLVIASPEGVDHLSIRFRPGGAHAVLGRPMDRLTNQVVELDAVLGPAAVELRDRLGEARDDRALVEAAEAWIGERLHAVHPHHATVSRAMDLLRRSDFSVGVGELCETLGLSNRHLAARFRSVVGLTPKRFARVARFHAVVAATRGVPDDRVDWAHLAYRFHFADQSHLVREFRHMSGVTPTAFLARRTTDDAHVALV